LSLIEFVGVAQGLPALATSRIPLTFDMDGLSFLDAYAERGQSNATLKIVLPNGEVRQVSDRICPFKFLDRCQ
jgi:hypothetical protein